MKVVVDAFAAFLTDKERFPTVALAVVTLAGTDDLGAVGAATFFLTVTTFFLVAASFGAALRLTRTAFFAVVAFTLLSPFSVVGETTTTVFLTATAI